jgi:hypothetical protein
MLNRTTPPDPTDARYFFETVCPAVLESAPDADRASGGRVAFRVHGERGGDFVVDLARAAIDAEVTRHDVFLELSQTDFGQLMTGALDFDGAVAGGRVRFRGDVAPLVRFGALLARVEDVR